MHLISAKEPRSEASKEILLQKHKNDKPHILPDKISGYI